MQYRRLLAIAVTTCFLVPSLPGQDAPSLLKKRKGHKTVLREKKREKAKPPTPLKKSGFQLVKYRAKQGKMWAYLSPPKKPTGKGPAIIWLTGGFPCSSPEAYLWEETDIENEQSARVYRSKGITMLFPTLRGGVGGNPGYQETFYGEVEDVISAFEYLKGLKHVDPKRIFLGGHSTGGTLALLTAMATKKFAAVISLGPTSDDYGKDKATHAWNDKERNLRAPIRHLASIKIPTYIIEGETGASHALRQLKRANKNKLVTVVEIPEADHFDIIHPVNSIFANAINKAKSGSLRIDTASLRACVKVQERRLRESRDLRELADHRRRGLDLDKPRTVTFYLYSPEEAPLKKITSAKLGKGFKVGKPTKHRDSDGDTYFALEIEKKLDLMKLKDLFDSTAVVSRIAKKHDLQYDDWTAQ